jgi:amino acid transporter
MHRRFMTATEQPEKVTEKVSLPTLTAMVVGSMIGSGVFLLPRRFGTETGVLGAIIAWTIAGTGMLMLAFVFQRLAMRKPDLDAGIFAYAQGGVRRLRRIQFGHRVLGVGLCGQYLVLGAHHGNAERGGAGLRRR